MPTRTTSAGAPKLEAFDGLRACAALSVLTFHVSQWSGLARGGVLAQSLDTLKAGVTVFFVISGFLLYLPYARAMREGQPLPDWRRFAERRVLRIIPAYWVALTVLAAGPLAATVATPDWWRYYGLTQIYSLQTMPGGLGVAWSLCVEVSFYALLPILARGVASIVRRRPSAVPGTQLIVIGAIALGSLGLHFAISQSLLAPLPLSRAVLASSLPCQLDWFAIGMSLAVVASCWEADARALPWTAALARQPLCWLLAAVCFALAVATRPGDLYLPLSGLATRLAFGGAAGFFVLGVVGSVRGNAPSRPTRLLATRPIAWLGVVSYGIYLWHVPLLIEIKGPLAPLAAPAPAPAYFGLLLAVGAGAVGLGAASWYLVERPAQRLRSRRRRPAQAPAGAPAR